MGTGTVQDKNAAWLLHELLSGTGLRVLRRPSGEQVVYLTTQDLENPALCELESPLEAAAPPACTRRLYSKPKCRSKSIARAILQFSGLEPVTRRCQRGHKHTVRYELGSFHLSQHGRYLMSRYGERERSKTNTPTKL